MNSKCEIKVYQSKNIVTMDILCDLMAPAEQAMKMACQKVWDYNPENILLKFYENKRINSAGIAMLIGLLTQSQNRGCKIFAIGLSEFLCEIFDIVGLTEYIAIIESEEEIG